MSNYQSSFKDREINKQKVDVTLNFWLLLMYVSEPSERLNKLIFIRCTNYFKSQENKHKIFMTHLALRVSVQSKAKTVHPPNQSASA